MIKLKVGKILDARHMTTEEFANGAGINIATARKYRRDTIDRYDKDILEKVCAFLNIDIDEVLERVND